MSSVAAAFAASFAASSSPPELTPGVGIATKDGASLAAAVVTEDVSAASGVPSRAVGSAALGVVPIAFFPGATSTEPAIERQRGIREAMLLLIGFEVTSVLAVVGVFEMSDFIRTGRALLHPFAALFLTTWSIGLTAALARAILNMTRK